MTRLHFAITDDSVRGARTYSDCVVSSESMEMSTQKTLLPVAYVTFSTHKSTVEVRNPEDFTDASVEHARTENTTVNRSVLFLLAYVFIRFTLVFQLDASDAPNGYFLTVQTISYNRKFYLTFLDLFLQYKYTPIDCY